MRALVLFYILVFYVLLQFSWWAYLLVEQNEEIYFHQVELLETKHAGSVELTFAKAERAKELKKRWLMVIGEGTVFLSLLLIGIYITNRAFRSEAELNRQQRNFLLSVTHEFKSPLAAVKLNLQTLQKRQLDEQKQKDVLRRAVLETDRIDTLVEKSLMAARLESKNFDFQKEEINLSDLVHRVVSDHIERRDPQHNITHTISPAIHIKGDSVVLSSLLVNLIENAEKYSRPDSTIEIALNKHNTEILLSVKDEGIGIAEKEKLKVFDKFYRVGSEDTRKTKGTGLGLYIVKHIVNLHHGKLTVSNNIPSGTIFTIAFPVET